MLKGVSSFFLLLLFFCFQGFAQVDSLSYFENKLENEHSEKEKGQLLLRLSLLYLRKGDNKFSKLYMEKGLEIGEKRQDSLLIGDAYSLLGLYNTYTQKNEEAMVYYIKAEKQYYRHPEKMPSLYLRKGELYYSNQDLVHALEMFRRSEKGALGTRDTSTRLRSWVDIGNVYFAKAQLDSALFFYMQFLQFPLLRPDSTLFEIVYNNVGNVYINKKQNAEGRKYLLKALRIAEKLEMKGALPILYYNLAGPELDLKQVKDAKAHILQSMKMGERTKNKVNLGYCYKLLARVDSALGLKDQAFKDQYNYIALTDSLHGTDMFKRMAEMQTKFDVDKKNAEITLLNKDKELDAEKLHRQQTIILLIISCLALFCLLSLILYRNFVAKKRANRLLEIQKADIETKRKLLAGKNQQIEDSIHYARRIQEAVLPSVLFSEPQLKDQFIFFKPRDIVSGDFYWSYKAEHFLFFATADCTGHGVPGAMLSMLGHEMLEHTLVDKLLREPAEILNELNLQLLHKLSSNGTEAAMDGMDVTFCRYDLNSMELTFAGARNDLVVVSENQLKLYTVDRYSIGQQTDICFTQQTVQLKDDDSVYLFSDGYYDQNGGGEGRKFMKSRFLELLHEVSSLPGEEQKKRLGVVFESWIKSKRQRDDVLVIGLKFINKQPNILT